MLERVMAVLLIGIFLAMQVSAYNLIGNTVVAGTSVIEEPTEVRIGSSPIIVQYVGTSVRKVIDSAVVTRVEGEFTLTDKSDGKVLATTLASGRKVIVQQTPREALESVSLDDADCELYHCRVTLEKTSGEQERVLYRIEGERTGRLLYFFEVEIPLDARVDAESGQIISIRKTWWQRFAF